MFLRNVGWLLAYYTGIIFQQIEVFIAIVVKT
jgi:hypothetical protein